MRPLEILLTLLNLAAFLALVFPRSRSLRATPLLPVAALLASGAQILFEGARWQMAPAYVMSALLLVASLAPRMKGAHVPLRGVVGYVGATFGALVLVLSSLLPLAFPVFRFPTPTGPYAIGTLTYHWIDADRAEIFTVLLGLNTVRSPSARRQGSTPVWAATRFEQFKRARRGREATRA